MQEWVGTILESPSTEPVVLVAVFLLGLLGSVTSCCNIAVIGAISGYSSSQERGLGKREVFLAALSFMLGTTIALGILGALAGFIGQAIGAAVGGYWKIFAGLSLVVLGLVGMKWIPLKLPKVPMPAFASSNGRVNAVLFGFVIGGGATACSACCNPVLPVVLGVASLQGNILWGGLLLIAFSIGWSLPLSAGLLGLGLGFNMLTSRLNKLEAVIRTMGGIVLVATGFFLIHSA